MGTETHQTIAIILSAIYTADTPDRLFSALETGCTTLGFDAFMLSSHRRSKVEMVMDPIYTTHDKTFRADYEEQNWIDDDMLIARTIGSNRAFVWDSVWDRSCDARSRDLLEFLQTHRMATGIMVPLAHKLGNVSFMALDSFRPKAIDPVLVEAAQLAAEAGQAKAEMLGLCPGISADEAIGMRMLNARQLEILKWITEGKSDRDIADIMNLRIRAVTYHVGHILRKLRVATRVQAARIFTTYSGHHFQWC